MKENILAQVIELNGMSMPQLVERWKALFASQPPVRNRAHMVTRLAYRIQELAYGGLPEETTTQLREIAEGHEQASNRGRKNGPVAGTRLDAGMERGTARGYRHARRVRVPWPALQVPERHRQGDHRHPLERAAVLRDPQAGGGRLMQKTVSAPSPLCRLYPQVHRRGSGQRFQFAGRPTRGGRSLRRQPAERGMGAAADRYDDGGFSGGSLERPALQRLMRDVEAGRDRLHCRLQG